jgi:hypothetical protein
MELRIAKTKSNSERDKANEGEKTLMPALMRTMSRKSGTTLRGR